MNLVTLRRDRSGNVTSAESGRTRVVELGMTNAAVRDKFDPTQMKDVQPCLRRTSLRSSVALMLSAARIASPSRKAAVLASMRAMRRCCFALAFGLAIAACGDAVPTRGDCVHAMAHVILLEDIESATGDIELTREAGKDMVANTNPRTVAQDERAMEERDRLANMPGESERRVKYCRAKMTKSEVDCMLRSTTPAAAQACVRKRSSTPTH